MRFVLYPDGGLKGGTAEDLRVSLAQASPELRQCVASCKHIAETAKQQNNFQKVSSCKFQVTISDGLKESDKNNYRLCVRFHVCTISWVMQKKTFNMLLS